MNPSPRFLMAICIGLLLVGFCPRAVAGQSIVDRIKKAAEDAKKKGEAKPPATTPSGTTPAQPNGAGPATPATPAKKADGRPAALMDSSGAVSTAGTWEIGADGTVLVVGQAGDAMERFRLMSPPMDTNVDTMGKWPETAGRAASGQRSARVGVGPREGARPLRVRFAPA